MKIMLYRKGNAGVRATIPGDDPEEEFEILLGGPVILWPINERLILVWMQDAEKLGLPINYKVGLRWALEKKICGDCLVAAADAEGNYIDITDADKAAANRMVLPSGERETVCG